jgi:hypothetical protein
MILLPGFFFIKIVSVRCSLEEYKVHHYLIDSLMISVVIYALVGLIFSIESYSSPSAIVKVFILTVILALIWSVIINKDILSKIFNPGDTRLSMHSKIFPVKGLERFKGKWHLVEVV